MDIDVNDILGRILSEIRPSEEDRARLLKIYNHVHDMLKKCIASLSVGENAVISLQGSVAKDTFLKNQSDIDIFILFDYKSGITNEWFENELIPRIVTCASNYRHAINYATHPYTTLYVEDVEVNIVPAFKVQSPNEIISAVDRTPFHTEYVKTHLTDAQKDEVRILKRFLKAWNLYGAEIEVQGFSGYLTELLILAYGTFYNLLRNAANWHAYRTCIDLEHHYPTSRDCLKRFEGDVLVVVDPVDPRRNAAAAVSLKKFSLFKLLAKMFLERPSIDFFKEDHYEPLHKEIVEEYLRHRLRAYDSCLYLVIFGISKPLPDIVWGQLNRLRSAIVNSLASYGLGKDVYAEPWVSPNLTHAVIVIELMQCSKRYKFHIGPPAYDVTNAIRFIAKNKDAEVGPWIDDNGRLYVIKKVDPNLVAKIINNIVSSTILTGMRFEKLIIVDDIERLPSLSQDFLPWLKRFLERKTFKKVQGLFT